ncbi:GNAT family N-acetyltransferase [Bifidobacterium sp.]|jgi:diamine N-acetyltransferase|uniref:GNAT family N-acetyltransferase n=1 Tax=Bifidobacterium sp. TaxID=41200 RepID=UPI0025BE6788|nr:GNAT family N-acetyltransferase [Bifidobacterium sp.]MCH4209962.1 GNAT family N-acetyltransferase [Bifidobacterium sp.]MCI1225244.1 GNAT family N-acetyltransferase [Bifidobacterium sp.]
MLHLELIDAHNFYEILKLKRPANEEYVADNSVSLAEAWLYRDDHTVEPRAIYHDDTLVGFVMTHADYARRILDIWRILIPDAFVNKGYGTQTLRLVIDEAKSSGRFDALELCYVPGNAMAEHVYAKTGFVATGAVEDGEIVMGYRLRP